MKKDLSLLPKFRYNCNLIGIKSNHETTDKSTEDKIQRLVDEREIARKNGDYTRADKIRIELSSLNVELNDGPNGVSWKIKH